MAALCRPVIHISYTDIRGALPIHMYVHGLWKLIMPYITCTENVKCTSGWQRAQIKWVLAYYERKIRERFLSFQICLLNYFFLCILVSQTHILYGFVFFFFFFFGQYMPLSPATLFHLDNKRTPLEKWKIAITHWYSCYRSHAAVLGEFNNEYPTLIATVTACLTLLKCNTSALHSKIICH